METARTQLKVLMLGANRLVCNNVRVLLTSMGYQCLVASDLKKAVKLCELEKPAILAPQPADSPPARLVASFQKQVPDLLGRLIVLVQETSDPELLAVLDAYSIRRVRLDALFQELWPAWIPCPASISFPGKAGTARLWSLIAFSNPRPPA